MSNLGFNTGYIEDLYRQYLQNADSVSESWREFFADYNPGADFVAPATVPAPVVEVPAAAGRGDGAAPEATPLPEDATSKAIRGPAARIVENMEASLGVPTATSVRTMPVKLMAENRALMNAHQRDVGGNKVSFTHLIAWALVKGMAQFPNMNTAYREEAGKPEHVIPGGVNLGLAIDIERRGRRSLLVPNIKGADKLTFSEFQARYNDLVRRARDSKLDLSDFQETTATLTNPGMIGTAVSRPAEGKAKV